MGDWTELCAISGHDQADDLFAIVGLGEWKEDLGLGHPMCIQCYDQNRAVAVLAKVLLCSMC